MLFYNKKVQYNKNYPFLFNYIVNVINMNTIFFSKFPGYLIIENMILPWSVEMDT